MAYNCYSSYPQPSISLQMSYMQKHSIMNIHGEKMVNMIHLIQLGIIHRDNV